MNNYNILVTGAGGQLGKEIHNLSSLFSNFNYHFYDRKELDICDYELLKQITQKNKINVIINCAAYTDVNNAELNKKEAFKINVHGVKILTKICDENKISLIHISTDYVFNGEKNSCYDENDVPSPINYYGISKYLGEKEIIESNIKNSIIIRTSWLYSNLSMNNFPQKIMKLLKSKKFIKVINNEIGSPTNAYDLSMAILKIIPKIKFNNVEIFHFSNLGSCSRFEFAKEIAKRFDKDCKVMPFSNKKTEINRPKYTVLCTEKFSNFFSFKIEKWSTSLEKSFK